jgi:acetyl-CoA carboxylase biotin carboxyl carrier protein
VAEIKVPSDINARVFKIEVAVGDAVVAGDTLMILESMKMEIPLEAPRAGKVARILVSEEEEIVEDQDLVILEG